MQPRVKILFENGAIRQAANSDDGVLGYLCTGASVAGSFELAKAYSLRKFSQLADLGVTAANNPNIVKLVQDHYLEAPEGTKIWLMAFPDTVKMSDMVDKDQDYGPKLLRKANGEINGLIVSRTPAAGYVPTITNGMDSDVETAMLKAQALGEWAANTLYAPIFIAAEGYAFNGTPADLKDLHTLTYNRVMCMLGDTAANSKGAAMGLLGGRIAASPVQRNIGRVGSGPLETLTAFIGDDPMEEVDTDTIYDKGFVTMRTFVRKSGYFLNDDWMATKATGDDYNHLTARRTIDKVARIAYDALVDTLLETIPINEDGTMQAAMAKSWQSMVEDAIVLNMTSLGQLSADPTKPADKGVVCFIDATQNVQATSMIVVNIRVRPFGYARYVDVPIGFQTVNV